MLFIFRQLRRLELRKRSGQYFLYAFGEILLIVIGILIAVQLGDWNQGRKDREEERVVLSRLLEELDKNLVKSGLLLRNNERKRLSLDQVALAFEGQPIDDNTAFLRHVNRSTNNSWTIQRLQRLIFNEFNNTGKLALIQSVELRDHITEHYSRVDVDEEILLSRTKDDYPVIVNSLVPNFSAGVIGKGMSEAQLEKIVESVLASELGDRALFERNRADFNRIIWEDFSERITELSTEIEAYLAN